MSLKLQDLLKLLRGSILSCLYVSMKQKAKTLANSSIDVPEILNKIINILNKSCVTVLDGRRTYSR